MRSIRAPMKLPKSATSPMRTVARLSSRACRARGHSEAGT
ncbi:Uncharacterised protein [Bordetella pertussis]|nr:Uncharacterised protein [Bordetella pertussis]